MSSSLRKFPPSVKLIILLSYLFLIALLSGMNSGTEAVNLSNTQTVIVMKILQGVGVLLVLVLPALLFALFFTRDKMRSLGLNNAPELSSLILGGAVMLAGMPLINLMKEVNDLMVLPSFMSGIEQWMKNSEGQAAKITEAFLGDTAVGGMLLNLVVIAFLAALSEEVFFRGVLQKTLFEYTRNIHAGVWIAAILFSAIHMQFYGFFPRMMMGVFLGYLFVWSGSLWLPIFAHFVNNGSAVIFSWLNKRGTLDFDPDSIGTGGHAIVVILLSALLVTVLVYFIYRTSLHDTLKARAPNAK